MIFVRNIIAIGPAIAAKAILLLVASATVFAQGQSTSATGQISQACGGVGNSDPGSDTHAPSSPSVNGLPSVLALGLESTCSDPQGVLGKTHASAQGAANSVFGRAFIRASAWSTTTALSDNYPWRADASGNLEFTRTATLHPPPGYAGGSVTVGLISTFATSFSGSGTGEGYVRLIAVGVDDTPFSLPLIVTHTFQKGDAPQAGLLSTPDFTILACPCTVTYTVVVHASATSEGNQSAFARAADPVYLKVPPGWAYSTDPPLGCAGSLDNVGASLSGGGDQGSVNLSIAAGCNWTASSDSPWLKITSGTSGSGGQKVRYTADPNPTGGLRRGTLTVAGSAFVVQQGNAGCSVGLSTQNVTVDPAGGTAALNVSADPNCEWTGSESAEWLNILQSAPTGSGPADLLVAPNLEALPRVGVATIAGRSVQLLQPSSNPTQTYQDVPLTHPFFNYVWLMSDKGITHGCGATTYCPDAPVTRGQMAVFVIRALMGDTFSYVQSPYFTDVGTSHPFFAYIQKMKELGITSGCAATAYCPDDPVTRGQMAVFIVRARLGIAAGAQFAYPATPYFTDVAASHQFFSFIQKMKDLGVTTGCAATSYCDAQPTTRGQMAVFIVRGLLTQ